ncbi:MAG: acyl carrier protein [Clostridia bacterium]|nr:acyl carrier protein [Clostridia bacterium]
MTIDKVKEMLANQLNIEVNKINENSKIVEDLGADSLDMIEMLMALEEEFNISVPDDKAEGLKTVGDIANFIDETVGADKK